MTAPSNFNFTGSIRSYLTCAKIPSSFSFCRQKAKRALPCRPEMSHRRIARCAGSRRKWPATRKIPEKMSRRKIQRCADSRRKWSAIPKMSVETNDLAVRIPEENASRSANSPEKCRHDGSGPLSIFGKTIRDPRNLDLRIKFSRIVRFFPVNTNEKLVLAAFWPT